MSQSTIHPALRDFNELPIAAQVRLPIVKSLLGVSNATVWRMVKAGQLKTYKFTLRTTTFNVGELREFLASKVEGLPMDCNVNYLNIFKEVCTCFSVCFKPSQRLKYRKQKEAKGSNIAYTRINLDKQDCPVQYFQLKQTASYINMECITWVICFIARSFLSQKSETKA